jgi:hypothetical protein
MLTVLLKNLRLDDPRAMTPTNFSPRAETILSLELVATGRWQAAAQLSWTAPRIESVGAIYASLLQHGIQLAVAPKLGQQLEVADESCDVTVDVTLLGWKLEPLEIQLGVSVVVLQNLLLSGQPAATKQQQGRLQHWLEEQLRELNMRCCTAAAEVTQLASIGSELRQAGAQRGATAAEHVHEGDLTTVRNERVPVEYSLLFDMLVATSQQMLSLSDILAIAKTMSMDDETVLGSINYYIDKRYLTYDREHHVVRLTAHGRAGSTNVPSKSASTQQ